MLSGTLTVRENITFSAALRLPRDISHGERKEKVDEIMEELNLSRVANSKVNYVKLPLISDSGCIFVEYT